MGKESFHTEVRFGGDADPRKFHFEKRTPKKFSSEDSESVSAGKKAKKRNKGRVSMITKNATLPYRERRKRPLRENSAMRRGQHMPYPS